MPTPGQGDSAGLPRVYLDVMLGSLARLLRMAGWDTAYAADRQVEADAIIRDEAMAEGRVLVTRDRQLADRTAESILLTTTDASDQVAELRAADYTITFDEPTRCATCNGQLHRLPATTPTPDHAPDPDATRVWQCRDCSQHFWRGSHWDDVVERLGVDDSGTENE